MFLFFCMLLTFLIRGYGQCEKVSDLNLTELTEDGVTLSWMSTNESATYEVEIKSKGRTPKLKQSLLTDQTSIHFGGLVSGSEYRLRVRTLCSDGSSSGSTKWLVFKTEGMNPEEDCPKVTQLKVASSTMTTATLAWTGSPFATHYEVEVRSKGNTEIYFFEKSLLDTSITIFGLVPNGKYHFRVRNTCTNSAVSGSTSWFDFMPGDSSEDETCPFIEDLAADSVTSTSAVIVWSTFGNNTVYELMVRDTQGNETVIAPAAPPQFIQGLSPSTEYEVSVIAHCEDGIPSQVNLFFTTAGQPSDSCSVPQNLASSPQDSNAYALSWDAVSTAVSYDLQIRDLDTLPNTLVDTNITEALYLFSQMDSLEGYSFRVRALCSAESMSDWSEYFFFPGVSDSVVVSCTTPLDLVVDTIIGNNAFLQWTATDAANYEIEIMGATITQTYVIRDVSGIGQFFFSGLQPQTLYECRVRPLCREQDGIFSPPVSFTTGDVMDICLPVIELNADRIDDNTAFLTWSGYDSASYEVEVQTVDSNGTTSLLIPSAVPELIVGGLSPMLQYEFRVRSVCMDGDTSFFTHWMNFSTADPQAGVCSPPEGIQLDSLTSTEAWITWLGIDTLEYRVFLKERDTIMEPYEMLTPDHFIYLDSLMPETEYEIQVQTICGDELSPLSPVFSFTTLMEGDTFPDSLCMIPHDLRLDSVDFNNAWISWVGNDSTIFEVEVTGMDFEYSDTTVAAQIWLSDLDDNSEYTIRVRSLCSDSTSSDWSEDFVFQTLEMPDEPEDSCQVPVAEIVTIGDETALSSWTSASAGAFYLIEVENIGLTPHYRLITTTRDTSYLFEGLVPGGTYQWKVAAFCPGGLFSDCTAWMTFTTEGEVECPAPEGLAVSQLTPNGATLTWNGSAAIDYEVEIQSLDSTPLYGTSNILVGNTLTVDDLFPGGSYQFKVNVQCLDGSISEDSDWLTFSTLISQDTGTISHTIVQSTHMVFPNPVTQTMTVRLPEEISDHEATIELTDMMGRLVRYSKETKVLRNALIQFEVEDLREGIYKLSVKSKGSYYHELVMIAR